MNNELVDKYTKPAAQQSIHVLTNKTPIVVMVDKFLPEFLRNAK
jgi:hypothetical protein